MSLGFEQGGKPEMNFARVLQEGREDQPENQRYNLYKEIMEGSHLIGGRTKQLSSAMLLSINKPSQKSNAIPARHTLALHKPRPTKCRRESKRMRRNEEWEAYL